MPGARAQRGKEAVYAGLLLDRSRTFWQPNKQSVNKRNQLKISVRRDGEPRSADPPKVARSVERLSIKYARTDILRCNDNVVAQIKGLAYRHREATGAQDLKKHVLNQWARFFDLVKKQGPEFLRSIVVGLDARHPLLSDIYFA